MIVEVLPRSLVCSNSGCLFTIRIEFVRDVHQFPILLLENKKVLLPQGSRLPKNFTGGTAHFLGLGVCIDHTLLLLLRGC